MNISHTYDHLGKRLEIRIVIDAYDLKAATRDTMTRQLRDHLKAEVAEVIQEMIREAYDTTNNPAS